MVKTSTTRALNKQVALLIGIVLIMFAFCYALVPLYNVFCKVTGLNGKTADTQAESISVLDNSRVVTIELLTTLNEDLPTLFHPKIKKAVLHPGEMITTEYWVENLTDKPMVIQAIPSVSPGLAAQHIQKLECFCFQKQPLAPRQGLYLPLRFTVDAALPPHIKRLTLSYTLFDITEKTSQGGSG